VVVRVALSVDERAILTELESRLADTQLDLLDAYYEGQQRLEQLGLAIPPQLQRFVVVVNWPQIAVDAVEERLDVEGFTWPDREDADEDLWRIWQANKLDEQAQQAHLDALVYGRSYVCVGTNEADKDTPLITVESPREVVTVRDPRTRATRAALRLWKDEKSLENASATLYLPDVTVWLVWDQGGWAEVDRDQHGLGRVPVVPMLNRPRTRRVAGVSEMAPVIPLTDAAARALTNAQVAQETHAVPQRGVLGASQGDFVDAEGKPLTVWEAYFGAVWTVTNENAKTFQFDASDMSNFERMVNLYARLVSGVAGIPPNYLGLAADDASSADAIRSREARLVKRCERKQTVFSGAWEQVMSLAIRLRDGVWNPDADLLVTDWRNPATPTRAQQADAAVKLVQADVIPREAAWEDLGYGPARRAKLREQFRLQAEADPVGVIARDLANTEPATPAPGVVVESAAKGVR
jgi:hypothetical protein